MAALRVVDAREHGQRLMHLVRNAGLTAGAASKLVSDDVRLVSWIVLKAKRVDAERSGDFANALAGKGQLTDDSTVLWHWLMGIENDPRAVLSPSLSVVKPSDGKSNRCCTQTPFDLDSYRAERELHARTSPERRAS